MYASFVIAYATCYFMGYSLKVLLLNDDMKKFDLYITPWLGMGLIICVLFPLSLLGYPVEAVARFFALAVLAVNIFMCKKSGKLVNFEKHEVIFLSVTAIFIGVIYGGVLMLRDFESYAVCTGFDFGGYLCIAKAILSSNTKRIIADIPARVAYIGWVVRMMEGEFRGCVFVPAFFAALFDMDLARIMYPMSAFVMFLNIATLRVFFKTSAKPLHSFVGSRGFLFQHILPTDGLQRIHGAIVLVGDASSGFLSRVLSRGTWKIRRKILSITGIYSHFRRVHVHRRNGISALAGCVVCFDSAV